jgi:hypothetical protein
LPKLFIFHVIDPSTVAIEMVKRVFFLSIWAFADAQPTIQVVAPWKEMDHFLGEEATIIKSLESPARANPL